ncbi:hypothetical protein C8R43DRAFT_1232223 [Mycena crocata]|nr:hypothetical protein C8R43DRAFT_1232223 [Mycena crocata]
MESPFARYLHTNYIPSDSEIKQIKALLAPRCLEVSRLESLIKDLSAQRDNLAEYISAHTALISPVRHLPRDIMQEIFIACLPVHRNAVMSAQETPVLLTRICSGWREVALATPALWASIHLPLDFLFHRNLTAPLTQWLERSGSLPLSLSIKGSPEWEERTLHAVKPIMDLLTQSANRWHRVDLQFLRDEGLPYFKKIYAPQLIVVTMECNFWEISPMQLLATPSLRAVTIGQKADRVVNNFGNIFDTFVLGLPLVWENLTSLTLEGSGEYHDHDGLRPHTALQVMSYCPMLIHFETDIKDYFEDNSNFPLQAPVFLPALQELILCRCRSEVGPDTARYFFDHLVMPALPHLQLPRISAIVSSDTTLRGLVLHSHSVEKFDIDLSGFMFTALIDTLRLSPFSKLTTLVVAGTGSRPEPFASIRQLLTVLVPPLGTEPVLPFLKELDLTVFMVPDNVEAMLLDFARRRLNCSTGRFRRLEVEYNEFVPSIAPDILASFAARGLTIITSSPPKPPAAATAWDGLKH